MVEKQEILTQEGYNKIEEEVEYLKTVKRKEVAERIKVAISFGDLSENAEYDEAKNEQAQVEEWWDYKITPMATNLQFVFYRNKANDVLVKVL